MAATAFGGRCRQKLSMLAIGSSDKLEVQDWGDEQPPSPSPLSQSRKLELGARKQAVESGEVEAGQLQPDPIQTSPAQPSPVSQSMGVESRAGSRVDSRCLARFAEWAWRRRRRW